MHNFSNTLSHSDMVDWAKREVMIAVNNEKADTNDEDAGMVDYAVGCYNSALKAFMSLTGDGHSGFSIGLTKNILDRLIDGKPLSPIEDTPDVWDDITEWGSPEQGYTEYQCKRMSSLFKKVYTDGTIIYNDVDQFVCRDIKTPDLAYTSGLVNRTVRTMFPITMPYTPSSKRYIVDCDEFLVDEANGDFDTVGILTVTTPENDVVPVNKFFKEDSTTKQFIEITKEEFDSRKLVAIK